MSALPRKQRSWRIRRRIGVPVLLLATAATTAVLGMGTHAASADTPVRGPQATSSASDDERAEAFTACMRSHGVSDFPGVTISANGQLQLKSGSINPVSGTYRAAAQACADLLPTGSALPTEPHPAAPAVPSLPLTCDGDDCPAPPKAPPAPS
jgi:hypothetical protein